MNNLWLNRFELGTTRCPLEVCCSPQPKRLEEITTKSTCCAGIWFVEVPADVICNVFKTKQQWKWFSKAEYPGVAFSMRQLILLARAGRTICGKEIVMTFNNFLIVVGEICNCGMSFKLRSASAKFYQFQFHPVIGAAVGLGGHASPRFLEDPYTKQNSVIRLKSNTPPKI